MLMRFELPWSWRTYLSFCMLAYLVSASHELAHHLAGYVSSGQFGRMSFNLFSNADYHPHPVLVSLAGPALTYTVAWIGAILLTKGIRPVLGYAMVACSCLYMRLVGVVGGGGDESVVSRTLTGSVHRWILTAIVAALVVPPLAIAFRSLANRRRVLVFLSSVFGPFLPLIVIRMIDQRWFAANVNAPESFHGAVLAGIPLVVLIADIAVLVVFLLVGKKYILLSGRARSFLAPTVKSSPRKNMSKLRSTLD